MVWPLKSSFAIRYSFGKDHTNVNSTQRKAFNLKMILVIVYARYISSWRSYNSQQLENLQFSMCLLKTSKSLDFNKKKTFLSACIYNSTLLSYDSFFSISIPFCQLQYGIARGALDLSNECFKLSLIFPSLTRSKIWLFYVYLNFSPSLVISFYPHGSTMSLNYFTRRNQYAFTELNIERVPPFCSIIISNDTGR